MLSDDDRLVELLTEVSTPHFWEELWEKFREKIGISQNSRPFDEMLARYNSIRPLLMASAASAMLGELPFLTDRSIDEIDAPTIAQTMSKVLGHMLTHRKTGNRGVCRLQVTLNVPQPKAVLDGQSFEVSNDVANFLQALVGANGSLISMTAHGVRSRQFDKLDKSLRDLIERRTGKGCWIPGEKLWRD